MKKGVKRIKPEWGVDVSYSTTEGLRLLREARGYFKAAGSSPTLARVNFAISSAKGAVRAAGYRERRAGKV